MGRISKAAPKMKRYHEISDLKFEDDILSITIDGEPKQYQLDKISQALLKASTEERNKYEISPSGYGIHWPLLDEDISIDGLLGVVHEPLLKAESL
jgi:hypothetical protein